MIRFALVTLIAALSFGSTAQATTNEFGQAGRFGGGFGSGSLSSGLSGKYFLADSMAVQATVGSWGWGWGALSTNVDVVWEMASLWSNQDLNINWHAGVGGALALGYGYTGLGPAGVVGAGLQLKALPIEVTVDVHPTFLFGDYWGGFYFGGGGAVRWYF